MSDRDESRWSRARCGGLAKSDPSRYDKIFFDQKGRPPFDPPYMKFCGPCPIRGFCLAYAVVHDEEGVWGGMTRTQRENLPPTVKKQLEEEAVRQGWLESRPSIDDLIRRYRKSQEVPFEELLPQGTVVEMQRQEFRFEFEIQGNLAIQQSAVVVQQVQVTVEQTAVISLPPLEELLGAPPHPTFLPEICGDSKEFRFPFEEP